VLQALGLLLAGPEGANQLLTRPLGWLRDEGRGGKIVRADPPIGMRSR
jgi:hypothetical protein